MILLFLPFSNPGEANVLDISGSDCFEVFGQASPVLCFRHSCNNNTNKNNNTTIIITITIITTTINNNDNINDDDNNNNNKFIKIRPSLCLLEIRTREISTVSYD